MKNKLLALLCAGLLVGCSSSSDKNGDGHQYQSGQFVRDLALTKREFARPVNVADYYRQIAAIKEYSPRLYQKYQHVYEAVDRWLASQTNRSYIDKFGVTTYQLGGDDHYGNVHFTAYYTPVIKARFQPDRHFKYPLYGMPSKPKKGRLPSRAAIHQGALSGKNLELAYTKSLIDNFVMGVQGSGYIDFEDGEPLTFFGYKGKNGHGYKSIGRLLVEQGEIEKDKISMQAIKAWYKKQDHKSQLALLDQNPSFVFFEPRKAQPVVGAAGVPLIEKASVASDRKLVPTGSVLLVEVPILDKKGQFTGKYDLRLMVALDVGGAIKGHRLDLYMGIGDEAEKLAGYYNHYGRVWMLNR